MKSILFLACMALVFAPGAYSKDPTWHPPDQATISWDACQSSDEYVLVGYNVYMSPYGQHATSEPRQTTKTQYMILFPNQTGRWIAGVSAIYTETATGQKLESAVVWSDGELMPEPFGWPVIEYPNNLRRQ